MMAKPIRALELHYPMIQFLVIDNRQYCIWHNREAPPERVVFFKASGIRMGWNFTC